MSEVITAACPECGAMHMLEAESEISEQEAGQMALMSCKCSGGIRARALINAQTEIRDMRGTGMEGISNRQANALNDIVGAILDGTFEQCALAKTDCFENGERKILIKIRQRYGRPDIQRSITYKPVSNPE